MKTLKNILSLIIVGLFISFSSTVFAQNTQEVKFQPDSKLQIDGTSTMHDFTIKATEIDGSMKYDLTGNSLDITGLNVVIPVKKMDSEKETMNDKMQDALDADDNPNISFTLTSPVQTTEPAADGQTSFIAKGNLSIAGKQKAVSIPVTGYKTKDGETHFKGTYSLLMTDYEVDPPSMFFGMLKTKDIVKITFDIGITFNETNLSMNSSK